ncbi:AAA family ATPase [uncultured Thiomicrorhabdus sp.]
MRNRKMIGILGSHRVGKTTLAAHFASHEPTYDFMQTSTSKVFRDLGLDPKQQLCFEERLMVQEKVLEQAEQFYKTNDSYAILDRTPIDYASYLLSEAFAHNTHGELDSRVIDYVKRCIDLANKYFGVIVLLQPGISSPDEEGKAKVSPAYQEHLNALSLGILMDERVNVFKAVIPRDVVNLEARHESLMSIIRQVKQQNNRNLIDVTIQ